ncbi:T9SS type A sorting domain-containing protein [Flavobacterium luteolum]|uniref:T9SS type A sorting domain-containing protein n=1 Tax=Flavobacterium luteolum TaxID=3003259 RepID=UPI00248EA4A8|nr:T9SS type A sorting domain-containing protein [Flavobacterium luteolum]
MPPSSLSAKNAVEVKDLLKININNASGTASIKLFDLSGKLIRSTSVNLNEKEISFSLADQPQGIYLLNVNDAKTSISSKIIKK